MHAYGLAPVETGEAHRRCRGVLLVVGVEQEDAVERAREDGVDLVVAVGRREHHAQEVLRVAEVVPRLNERQSQRVPVGHGREDGHLRNEAIGRCPGDGPRP